MWETEAEGEAWSFGFLSKHGKKYFPVEIVEHAILVRADLLNCKYVVLDDLVRLQHTNNLHRKHLYK